MTERVDFYVLAGSTVRHRWVLGCRLAEKAYLRDLSVVVLSDTAAEAAAVDELLWTFSDRSFVPHELIPAAPPEPGASPMPTAPKPAAPRPAASLQAASLQAAPVRVTPDLAWVPGADLLVNLSDRMPAGLERFARIAEIIDADDTRRRLGRERFKAYRDLKMPVETHTLDEARGD